MVFVILLQLPLRYVQEVALFILSFPLVVFLFLLGSIVALSLFEYV